MNDRTDDSIGLHRAQSGGRGSALAAYQDVVLGERSWLGLLRHELVVAWGGALPGCGRARLPAMRDVF